METLSVFVLGFIGGIVGSVFLEFSKKIMRRNLHTPDARSATSSRIYRPFSSTPKRKPRVNSDKQAWLKENDREV